MDGCEGRGCVKETNKKTNKQTNNQTTNQPTNQPNKQGFGCFCFRL
jgi:hypothetical protein